MAHIQVFYRDLLKDEVELRDDVTTIGRNSDSDIMIDNAGVSAHHARIIKEGDVFIIEDTESRNGTFVNGKRVSRQLLSEGDEVIVSKHILKLTQAEAQASPPRTPVNDAQHLVQDATVEVDVSNLGDLIKQRQANFAAYLLLTGMQQKRSKYPLTKLNFKIGKAIDADISTRVCPGCVQERRVLYRSRAAGQGPHQRHGCRRPDETRRQRPALRTRLVPDFL